MIRFNVSRQMPGIYVLLIRVSSVNTLVQRDLWLGYCDWPLSRCCGASLLSGWLFCNGPDWPKEDLCPRATSCRGCLHAHHRCSSCTYEKQRAYVCVSPQPCAGSQVSVCCSGSSYSSGMSKLNKSQQACRSLWSTDNIPAGITDLLLLFIHSQQFSCITFIVRVTLTKSSTTSKEKSHSHSPSDGYLVLQTVDLQIILPMHNKKCK